MMRYFTWETVGDVDIERPRTGSLGERGVDGVMPGWFLSLCDTGSAIAKLSYRQRQAVSKRWRAAVALEEAQRDVLVISMGASTRLGGSLNDAEGRVEFCKRALGWWEDRDSYQSGMAGLLYLFGRGGSSTGQDRSS